MGLIEYKKKRSFKDTPEPTGGKASGGQLQFVIQKHDASRLHYDFRLELNGVLKSWAVPKGPSLNPADKRLAMLVEDHPFDYRNFEGIIPEGNYGAGTVIVWDSGTYEPLVKADTKADQEKLLLQDFEKGSIKIKMNGKKINGEFALVKLKGRQENAWLLIKHRDQYASEEDIVENDKSVVSGKTIDQLSVDKNAKQWQSNKTSNKSARVEKPVKAVVAKNERSKPAAHKVISRKFKPQTNKQDQPNTAAAVESLSKKKKSKIPEDVKPMLATLVDKAFDDENWLYEVKWDGYRSISYLNKGNVDIRSRNNKDFNKKFYPIYNALKDWPINAVVDGEIIVVDDKGQPDFNALQLWRSEADGQLIYYVFDILWVEGYNLMSLPLIERREVLKKLIPDQGVIRLSENFTVTGTEFFALADKMGLEGIIAKKADGVYEPEIRSKQWLKIKTLKHQEAVIAGYTRNAGTSKKFSALLMGVYENGVFVFMGPVGTGFTAKQQAELLEKLKPLQTKNCPFAEVPEYNKPSRFRPNPPKADVVWVEPKIVAEVTYRAISDNGSMRHPSFKGIREDKEAKEVVREKEVRTAEIVSEDVHTISESVKDVTSEKSKSANPKIITPPVKGGRKTLLNPSDETQARSVEGHELKFTNLSKVFWPEDNVTKRDLLNYYYQVVPYMLPYMKDRPQTLNRFPNGIHGKSFYQKDVTGKVPSWIETYKYFSEGDQREKHFMVCTDESSLMYIASLGCIEMNPWSSRVQAPDNPDWCIIDLDPDKKNTFEQVIQAAQVTKEILDALELPSYCKTSGSTGIHIYIPLGAKYVYEDSKEFARSLVKLVHTQLPAFTSIERKVSDRNGKMYLDFLQNRPQATIAAPYSLRPKPGATVSMPLHWDEVKKGLSMKDFTIKNAISRLKETGDLFTGVLGEGVDIPAAVEKIEKVLVR